MGYFILPIIIASIMLVKLDWTILNTSLIIMFCISCSELLRNVVLFFQRILNDVSLEKLLDLKIHLDKKQKSLKKWSDSLLDASKETVILQIKSFYVLLIWATQRTDPKMFNVVISKLKLMKVPDEYLVGHEKLSEFIKLAELNEYEIKFDQNSDNAYFERKNKI